MKTSRSLCLANPVLARPCRPSTPCATLPQCAAQNRKRRLKRKFSPPIPSWRWLPCWFFIFILWICDVITWQSCDVGDRQREDDAQWQQFSFWKVHRDWFQQTRYNRRCQHANLSAGKVAVSTPHHPARRENLLPECTYLLYRLFCFVAVSFFKRQTSETITSSTNCAPVRTCPNSTFLNSVSFHGFQI